MDLMLNNLEQCENTAQGVHCKASAERVNSAPETDDKIEYTKPIEDAYQGFILGYN